MIILPVRRVGGREEGPGADERVRARRAADEGGAGDGEGGRAGHGRRQRTRAQPGSSLSTSLY